MREDLLDKVRKLNWVLQEGYKESFSFDELCKILSELTDSNVYLADTDGNIIGVCYTHTEDSAATVDPITGLPKFQKEYNEQMMKIAETKANFRNEEALAVFKYHPLTKNKFHTIIPVKTGADRWGNLILIRYKPEFSTEDLVLCEFGATVVAIEMRRKVKLKLQEVQKEAEIVEMAFNSLSYSEGQAVSKIFGYLDGDEGVIVASMIAEKSDITRSVIVNSLRKLEGAGVIRSRSLGMKGTHIKVLNSQFFKKLGTY